MQIYRSEGVARNSIACPSFKTSGNNKLLELMVADSADAVAETQSAVQEIVEQRLIAEQRLIVEQADGRRGRTSFETSDDH